MASGKTYAAIREIFNKQPLVPVGTTPRALQHPLVVRMSGPDEIRRDSASDLQPHRAIARSRSSLSIPSTAEIPRSPSTTRPHSTRRPTSTAARAERERLHDVRASSDAAVDERIGATARRVRLRNSNRTPATAGFQAPLLRTPRGSRVLWAASSASVLVQCRVMIDPLQRT